MFDLLHWIFLVWNIFWLYCKWLWLRLNQTVFESGTGAFKTKHSHRILLLGDGYAAGYGDYVTFGTVAGVSGRIRRYLRGNPTIRQSWWLVQRGHLKATSADWLPNNTAKPQEMNAFYKTSLWNSVFSPDRHLHTSDIAVISLGTFDFRDSSIQDAQTTVDNIDTICRKLASMNIKHIYVCNVYTGMEDKELAAINKERHILIADYIKKNNSWIRAGPDLSNYRYASQYARYSDGIHMCDHGYKLFTQDIFDCIRNGITQVEWDVFKEEIRPSLKSTVVNEPLKEKIDETKEAKKDK